MFLANFTFFVVCICRAIGFHAFFGRDFRFKNNYKYSFFKDYNADFYFSYFKFFLSFLQLIFSKLCKKLTNICIYFHRNKSCSYKLNEFNKKVFYKNNKQFFQNFILIDFIEQYH